MKRTPWYGGFKIEPWVLEYLVTTDVRSKDQEDHLHTEQTSKHLKTPAKKVCVLKLLENVRADGSIVKEVSDGDVSVRAVFTAEALQEFSQGSGDSTPPNWDKSLIILQTYHLRHLLHADQTKCLFEIVVTQFAFWALLDGFKPKTIHTYCMDISEVQRRSHVLWELNNMEGNPITFWRTCRGPSSPPVCYWATWKARKGDMPTAAAGHGLDMSQVTQNTAGDDMSMGSIALSQLLAQMTESTPMPSLQQQQHQEPEQNDESEAAAVRGGPIGEMPQFISEDIEPEEYVISSSQEDALDKLPEWQPDYKSSSLNASTTSSSDKSSGDGLLRKPKHTLETSDLSSDGSQKPAVNPPSSSSDKLSIPQVCDKNSDDISGIIPNGPGCISVRDSDIDVLSDRRSDHMAKCTDISVQVGNSLEQRDLSAPNQTGPRHVDTAVQVTQSLAQGHCPQPDQKSPQKAHKLPQSQSLPKTKSQAQSSGSTPKKSAMSGDRITPDNSPEKIRNNVMAKLDNITALVSRTVRRATPESWTKGNKSIVNSDIQQPSSPSTLVKLTTDSSPPGTTASQTDIHNVPCKGSQTADSAAECRTSMTPTVEAAAPRPDRQQQHSQQDSQEQLERMSPAGDVGDYMEAVQLDMSLTGSGDQQPAPCEDAQTGCGARKLPTESQASKQPIISGSSDNDHVIPGERCLENLDTVSQKESDTLESSYQDAQRILYTPEQAGCSAGEQEAHGEGKQGIFDSQTQGATVVGLAQSTQYDDIRDSQLPPPAFPVSPVRCRSPPSQTHENDVEMERCRSPPSQTHENDVEMERCRSPPSQTHENDVEMEEVKSDVDTPQKPSPLINEDGSPKMGSISEVMMLRERLDQVRMVVEEEDAAEEKRLAQMRRHSGPSEVSNDTGTGLPEASVSPQQSVDAPRSPSGAASSGAMQISLMKEIDSAADRIAVVAETVDQSYERSDACKTSVPCVSTVSPQHDRSAQSSQSSILETQPFTVHSEPEPLSPELLSEEEIFQMPPESPTQCGSATELPVGGEVKHTDIVGTSDIDNQSSAKQLIKGGEVTLVVDNSGDGVPQSCQGDSVPQSCQGDGVPQSCQGDSEASTAKLTPVYDISSSASEPSVSQEHHTVSHTLQSSGDSECVIIGEVEGTKPRSTEVLSEVNMLQMNEQCTEQQGTSEVKAGSEELVSSGELAACVALTSSSDGRCLGSSEDSSSHASKKSITGDSHDSVPTVSGSETDAALAQKVQRSQEQQKEGQSVDPGQSHVSCNDAYSPLDVGNTHVEKEVELAPSEIQVESMVMEQSMVLGLPKSVPVSADRDPDSDTISICSTESDRRSVRSSSSSTQVMRSTAVKVLKQVKQVSEKVTRENKRRDTMTMITNVVGKDHGLMRQNSEVLYNLKKKTPAKSGADVFGQGGPRRRRHRLYQESVLLPLGESVLEETTRKSTKFHLHVTNAGRSPGSSLAHSPSSNTAQNSRGPTPSPGGTPGSGSRAHTPPASNSPGSIRDGGATPVQASRPTLTKTPSQMGLLSPIHAVKPTTLLSKTPSQIPHSAAAMQTSTPARETGTEVAVSSNIDPTSSGNTEVAAKEAGNSETGNEESPVPRSKTNLLFKYPSVDIKTMKSLPQAGGEASDGCAPPPAPAMASLSVQIPDGEVNAVVSPSSSDPCNTSEIAEPLLSPNQPCNEMAVELPAVQSSEPSEPCVVPSESRTSSQSQEAEPMDCETSEPQRSERRNSGESLRSSSVSQRGRRSSSDSQQSEQPPQLGTQHNVIIDTIKRLNSMPMLSRTQSVVSQTQRRRDSMDSIDSLILVPKTPRGKTPSKGKTPKAKTPPPHVISTTPKSSDISKSPKGRAGFSRLAKKRRRIIVEVSEDSEEETEESESEPETLQVKIPKKRPGNIPTVGTSKRSLPGHGPVRSPETISLCTTLEEEEDTEDEDQDTDGNMEKLQSCILQFSERINRQQRPLVELKCPPVYKDVFNYYKRSKFTDG